MRHCQSLDCEPSEFLMDQTALTHVRLRAGGTTLRRTRTGAESRVERRMARAERQGAKDFTAQLELRPTVWNWSAKRGCLAQRPRRTPSRFKNQ